MHTQILNNFLPIKGQKRLQDYDSTGNRSFEEEKGGPKSSRYHTKNELEINKPKRNMRQTIIDPSGSM